MSAQTKFNLNRSLPLKRKKFSKEEDEKLNISVGKLGTTNWGRIARQMEGRSARQCRERWRDFLSLCSISEKDSDNMKELKLEKIHKIDIKAVEDFSATFIDDDNDSTATKKDILDLLKITKPIVKEILSFDINKIECLD